MMKIVLLCLILFNLSFAYKVNDKLDANIAYKLGLKKDKIYILSFFASWCATCKKELPILSNTKLASNFELIGINVDENLEVGKNFVKELDLTFKVIYDHKNEIISKFDPIGVPAIYYIKNLSVKKRIFGAVNHIDEVVKKDLKALEAM